MHRPLPSVSVLARFTLDSEAQTAARERLLAVTDWQAWINQIELHGLSGFANKHIQAYGLPVPEQLNAPLKALKMRHHSAAKARYQALQQIDTVFQEQGIDYLALKGAALMPHLYGQAYLRPMRDMDLLLRRSDLSRAADALRSIGFHLPHAQPSKFMRDVHQLPNATKTIDGFVCSVELHLDGVSRDTAGHCFYPESHDRIQSIGWQALTIKALDDLTMLHQVTLHLEGLHPGSALKLINVMDVVGLAQRVLQSGQWRALQQRYPHVLNTLRCLHLWTPLPSDLQSVLAPLPTRAVSDVGIIMQPLGQILGSQNSWLAKLRALFRPSDWWLHLHYHVDPTRSLWHVKWLRHPASVLQSLVRRVLSAIRGG